MKFRVLFIVALLALSTFAFAQPKSVSWDYPGDWECSLTRPLTGGSQTCFTGTPFPDGTPLNIYVNGTLTFTWLMNGNFVCAPGYFSTIYYDINGGTTVYLQASYNYCTYTSRSFSITTDETFFMYEQDWTCECNPPQEQFDFGDLGWTHQPPLVSEECPNNGPAGVPYPNPSILIEGCHLGQGISAEPGPRIENLDTFDDGVVFIPGTGPSAPMWDACMIQCVDVTVVGGGTMFLSAWKDGNMDGDFADVLCLTTPVPAPEWIIQDVPVECPGVYRFCFKDPGCPVGAQGYDGVFRFILCNHPVGSFGWQEMTSGYGEIEDYYQLYGDPGHQLPVELTAAPTVTVGDRQLTLSFNVSDETDVNTYEIWRDGTKVTELTKTNGSYSYVDKNLSNNRLYNYTIVAVSLDEQRKELSYGDGENHQTVWSGTPSYLSATVTEYALHQNYPNPFNPTTEIVYDVVETGVVTLKVFNVMGQEVATLVNGTVETGRHAATFDATGLTSGLYFYTITIGDKFSATKKMLLVQ
jgi:hypothetical protein